MHPRGTVPGLTGLFVMDNREVARKAIQHYRRLRAWVTDPQARRTLRELIRDVEGKLAAQDGLADGDEVDQ